MKQLIFTIAFAFAFNLSNATTTPNDPNSLIKKVDVKRVIKIQKGVTNYKGETGVYLFYVLPSSSNFNLAKHRVFVTNSQLLDLRINK